MRGDDTREAVARAIAAKDHPDDWDGDEFSDEFWETYLACADAAILATLKAIREPSEAMIEAGLDCPGGCEQDVDGVIVRPATIFWAMIGAGIAELSKP